MRTLAHSLIQRRFVEKGETTRIVVLPIPDSGLPSQIVEASQPVPLNLLAGRPVNLELDVEGLSADLCFQGPPVRCRFLWKSVVAVQNASGAMTQTLVVTVSTVMEDSSLLPVSTDLLDNMPPTVAGASQKAPRGKHPAIAVLDGGGTPKDAPERDKRPKLEVITSPPKDSTEP